ncbi:hypothetical protein D3C85_1826230 [compost metagenome]
MLNQPAHPHYIKSNRRQPAGPGFQDDQRQPFIPGRQHEQLGNTVVAGQNILVADRAEENYAVLQLFFLNQRP